MATNDETTNAKPTKAEDTGRLERDRVRRMTFKRDLERIDEKTREAVSSSSGQGREAIDQRIAELDREWPVDRALMVGAVIWIWTGLILGRIVDRKFRRLSFGAGGMLMLYALFGWAPPVILIRRLGFRTRDEIESERIALKALRGDFENISAGQADQETRIDRALQAAN